MNRQANKQGGQFNGDRLKAISIFIDWFEEIQLQVLNWRNAVSNDEIRESLHFLVESVLDSCKAIYILVDKGFYDQAGALLRVAIERTWLVDFFASEHPEVECVLKKFVCGNEIKPWEIRRRLSEEMEMIGTRSGEHLETMSLAYKELCGYIHPRPESNRADIFDRNLILMLCGFCATIPVFFDRFSVSCPDGLLEEQVDVISQVLILLVPDHPIMKAMVADFEKSIRSIEFDY